MPPPLTAKTCKPCTEKLYVAKPGPKGLDVKNCNFSPTAEDVEQGAGNIFYITQGYSRSYLRVRGDGETCWW